MRDLRYRILNVFTRDGERLSGNPLCVFEDAAGLDEGTMRALARQTNLSETTFLFPPTEAGATARVRIFTPTIEMPFAGHPTLGTADVVRSLHGGDEVVLEMAAGLVPVRAAGGRWTLRTAHAPETRPVEATPAELAATLGLSEDALGPPALWVDTGAEQLVVPLRSVAAVDAARPDPARLARHGYSARCGESMIYVWAPAASGEIVARFFFVQHGAVLDDPATGSACANLGGYHVARGERDLVRRVLQGERAGRPSELALRVDADGAVFVGGAVVELGRGVFTV